MNLLNINNDSIFQAYDRFLFWNVHPTSNKEKNAVQIQQMKTTFIEITQLLPEYKIILGGDFNSAFSPTIKTDDGQEDMKISYFPRDPSIPTCKKMRTMMQPQKNKANKLDQSPKDYFVSQLPIVQQKCSLISGQELDLKNLPLLPNKEHPYDHYLVCTNLQFKQKVIKIINIDKR